MTICIAWRDYAGYRFASDSRITFGQVQHADIGIKVFDVGVNVRGPGGTSTAERFEFQAKYGMCFAGSAVNGFLLKEAVSYVLGHLQCAPGYTDLSFESITNLAFEVYTKYSGKLTNALASEAGLADVLIGGYCPKLNEVRVCRFTTDKVTNRNSKIYVVLNKGQHLAIGSKTAANFIDGEVDKKRRKNVTGDFAYLKSLHDTIAHSGDSSVGGAIQYGKFTGCQFNPLGSVYLDTSDGRSQVRYMRFGLDLNGLDALNKPDSFVVDGGYIMIGKDFDTYP